MEETALSWLTGEFSVLGIQLQNWMPLVLLIVALAIVAARRR